MWTLHPTRCVCCRPDRDSLGGDPGLGTPCPPGSEYGSLATEWRQKRKDNTSLGNRLNFHESLVHIIVKTCVFGWELKDVPVWGARGTSTRDS